MSRNRFSFRSTPSTQEVPKAIITQTPEQKKDAANSGYWDAVYGEDWTNGKGKDVERLWGIENFGNTCYCNSVLQALYACQPFRAFVEAYPNTPPPVSALGPPPGEANVPNDPEVSSPLATKKDNPFDNIPPTSPTGGEKKWKLGRKNTITAPTPTPQTPVEKKPVLPPPSNYPPLPAPNPDQPSPNVFETIQTLFQHLSMSPPHQPLPSRKDPKKEGETAQTASLLAPTTEATVEGAPAAPKSPNPNEPQGPPLLASLPPPSAPRGGGPFSAGSLGRGVVRPEDVLKTIKRENEMFRGMAQQDAHEFLGWVLNKVAEEVEPLDKHLKSQNKPAVLPATKGIGKTFIQNLFEGSLTNETRCLSCETTSSRDELFLDLSIDIEQHTSVTSCLRGFSASEMLCQKNKFYCDSCCGLQEAEKRMKIKRLPHILPLHLKRFKYQESLGRYTKLFYRVPFPLQLRLPNTSDDAEDPDRLYELFAVVVHIGNGPHHGHYVCLVKSAGRWVMCDDENVEPIDESDIFRYFGDYPSGAGYVMFYQAADLDLGSLGLKVPPPIAKPASKPKPAPVQAAPAPTPTTPVPAPSAPVSAVPQHETLIELDEPEPEPRSLPQADILPPIQTPAPAQRTPSQISTSVQSPPETIQRTPSSTPVHAQRTPSQTTVQRTPSQSAQKDKDTKWYQRKKSAGPTSPPATTTFNGLGVSVPNHLHGTNGNGTGNGFDSPDSASIPSTVEGQRTRSQSQSNRAVSSSSTSGNGSSTPASGSGPYAGGSGLGRKLSGMSGKGLMSRSGSLMKLGLGKKDKKEGIEE